MGMKKVVTPDWVSKVDRRKRNLSMIVFGLMIGTCTYFALAIFLNLFTEIVDLPLWRSLAGLAGCGFGFWFAWGAVPKKSVWIAGLEKARSRD